MSQKNLIGLLVTILVLNCIHSFNYVETSQASVLPKYYVDDNAESSWYDVSGHFATIQEAIDAASSSDRILVYAGTYTENLIIDSTKTYISIFGEDKSLVTLSGGGSNNVINISAQGVDISSMTITNCGTGAEDAVIKINASDCIITDNTISNTNGKNGIYIHNCTNTKIYYNTISGHKDNGIHIRNSNWTNITFSTISSNTNNGIFAYNSSHNTIDNCDIKSNSVKNGIHLNMSCNNNTISNSNISSNKMNGIFLNDFCENNTITSNDGSDGIYSNQDSGIRIENSSYNTFDNNIISTNTDYGIMIVGNNNTIHTNRIRHNLKHGIFLFGDHNNLMRNNYIKYNTYDGIRSQNSTNDNITSNEISNNNRYGVYLSYFCINNLIYNNYFHDNTDNARDMSENNNRWYDTTHYGTNIINGENKKISGNFWDDQTVIYEYDNDGIYNSSSYNINISANDSYPIYDRDPPVVQSVSSPSGAQLTGTALSFSATITDVTEIEDVCIVIPEVNINCSILQNKSGDTYSGSITFSSTGIFTLNIFARDSRNWINEFRGNISIYSGSAPSVTDNSETTGSPNTFFTINVTVPDNSDSDEYPKVFVTYSHNSVGTTLALNNIDGSDFYEAYIPLEKSTEPLIYSIKATNQWQYSTITDDKTVSIIDSNAPTIEIDTHGRATDDIPTQKRYLFGANITDDVSVSDVTIEYWYEDNDHLTVNMDHISDNYYRKNIYLDQEAEKVYCIIYATDPSGNQNDSTKPIINSGGPYIGVIGEEITFDASECYDLDGSISSYLWDFGDGTTGGNVSTSHTYLAKGNYTVTLTITDNDGNSNIETTYVDVIVLNQTNVSQSIIDELKNEYDTLTLNSIFYSYDSNGDEIPDTFFDPNNELYPVHSGYINISGYVIFLLSVDDDEKPEFMWNVSENKKINISNISTTNITVTETNTQLLTATAIVGINKSNGWIYIEINDPELANDVGSISDILSVTKDGEEINSDRIIRKTAKTYILDDPDTEYILSYSYEPYGLTNGYFTPGDGGLINEDTPKITFSYNVTVYILQASFYNYDHGVDLDIGTDITSYDQKTFYYTPPNNLEDGFYYLDIDVEDSEGNVINELLTYQFESYVVEESEISLTALWIIIGSLAGALFALLIIMKIKNINFESFIYIKNRKIIPFFKPIVFGPLSFDVNDKKVSKAEFYVNGKLKDTLTQEPFKWYWNETAFMKHTIEAKVYDEEGNTSSTGEMTFFVFNSPKLFK